MTASDEDRARSIRQRLLNEVRRRGEDEQFVLVRYATERLLFRLGNSRHREQFVLKGATLFALWGTSLYRPTRDLDFTGFGTSEAGAVCDVFREICSPTSPDGVVFDLTSIESEPIRDQSDYVGLRIRFNASLGRSNVRLQIDVGFGNAIHPPAEEVEFPTLLDDPPPRIRAYRPEAVVAEKMHALVVLGERNSRYKDFYDLCVMATRLSFVGEPLLGAIKATFDRRSTPITGALPVALTPPFFEDAARSGQWRSYVTRSALPGAPYDFSHAGELILRFLGPLWSTLSQGEAYDHTWPPGGPWQ